MAVLRFKSGALGLIEGTTSAYPGFATRLDVHGDQGSVMLENDLIKFWQFKNGVECDESLKVKGEQSAHSFQRVIRIVVFKGLPHIDPFCN